MNTPFKKIFTLIKEKQGEVCSRDSLTWTPDDKLLVCCSEKLLLVNVLLNQHSNFSPNQEIFTAVTEGVLSILDLPDYSLVDRVLGCDPTFQHLKDVERQQMMADPLLMDSVFLQFSPSKIFKKAVCSSILNSNRASYLIACVTFGARVFIFFKEQQDFKPFECTELIKKELTLNMSLPIPLKRQGDFDTYVSLMHSMSTVEILWSELFTIEKYTLFSLLITGSRNGDVHIWRVGLEFGSKGAQFVWQFTDKYQSEVMSLAWLTRSHCRGLLAIGYVDGSIRCLDVTAACDKRLSITVKEVMVDLYCDGLSVTGMGFGETSQGTEILLACKQYFLHLYTVSDSDGAVVKYCNHFDVDIALPLNSLDLRGMFGVASSQDSAVIVFEVQETLGEISVVQSRQDFETVSNNAPSFSCGATLSPSSALCFCVQKTEFNLQPQRRNKTTEKQVVLMSIPFNLTLERMMLNLRDSRVSTKDTVLNLCLYTKGVFAETSEGEGPKLGQISDILKLLQGMSNDRGLQIALALMKFLKSFLQSKSNTDSCREWLSIAYNEALKKRLSQHATSLMKLPDTLSEIDYKIISCVKKYWNPEQEGSSLDMLQRNMDQRHPLCSICGCEFLPDSLLTAKCKKGHKANLCCLSCQPCQDLNIRKCETCGVCALSQDVLSDSHVIQDKFTCSICGSHFRESTWT